MKKVLCTAAVCLTAHMGIFAQDVELEWYKAFKTANPIVCYAMTMDADEEHVFLAGEYSSVTTIPTVSGNVTLDYQPKREGYGTDVFILKVNKAGDVIWAKSVGGQGQVSGNAIAVDRNGNVYVTGTYKDTTDFNPGSGQSLLSTSQYEQGTPGSDGYGMYYNENSYVLKLNPDGEFDWVRDFYGYQNVAKGLAAWGGAEGYGVCVTGSFSDTVDFNQRSGTDVLFTRSAPGYSDGRHDMYVLKLNQLGDLVWLKAMGGMKGKDEGHAVYVDDKGYVFTTGEFSDSADFDPGSGNAILRSDAAPANGIFISKLDAQGNHVFAVGMGSTTATRGSWGSSIKTDRFGDIAITGTYQVSADMDPLKAGVASQIVGNGNVSAFVARYDSLARFKWVKPLTSGASGVQQGWGVALDDAGSVYTVGHFTNDINLNPNNNPPVIVNSVKFNVPNVFVSKFDSAGNYAWSKHYRAQSNAYGYAINVNSSRHVYLTGFFMDTLDVNPDGLPELVPPQATNSADAFLIKLSCADKDQGDEVIVSICGDEYEFNNKVYRASGKYESFFFNQHFCDSIVLLDLTLNEVPDPQIDAEEDTLFTSDNFAGYQWFFFNDSIPGANSARHVVTENGEYTVQVISKDSCSAISSIYHVTNVGIGTSAPLSQISVYPNPAGEMLYISRSCMLEVYGLDGRLLLSSGTAVNKLDIRHLQQGVYLLRFKDKDPGGHQGAGSVMFIKEN